MSNEVSIGNRIILKSWSQIELSKQINSSREFIIRYERNESISFIDMVIKLEEFFGVNVDFLVSKSYSTSFDKETVERIIDIQIMDGDTKAVLFNHIDTYIQNFKTKKLSISNV